MNISDRDTSRLRNLVGSIDEFDAQCSDAHYTDTDEAWYLLRMVRDILAEVVS